MSCCKNNTPLEGVDNKNISVLGKILFFIIGFTLITMLLPVIWGVLIYFLFNSSIRNKDTNILPAMTFIWNVILKQDKSNDEDDDDDDEDDNESFDEDDYELLDYEKID